MKNQWLPEAQWRRDESKMPEFAISRDGPQFFNSFIFQAFYSERTIRF